MLGAGKTTISRLFFRFYDVLGGAVRVNGKDVRSVSQRSLRNAIGVVPQNGKNLYLARAFGAFFLILVLFFTAW